MTEPSTDQTYDIIIVGAGVIGCAIALEMSRRGHRTLNVDKAASAGAGSTINSCAIVRFSYSTIAGVNFAWEGGYYWRDWANYIGAEDELGLIEFHQVGQLLPTAAGDHWEQVRAVWDEIDIPYDALTVERGARTFPVHRYGPVRTANTPRRP